MSGQALTADSIAPTSAGSSGSTCGAKRATTSPSRPTRNFSKFHRMSPSTPSASAVVGELLVERVPVVAVHLDLLEERERDAVGGGAEGRRSPRGEPGSCSRNWLHGTPMTVKPWSAYCSWIFSSPSYCGVSPHFDATLTTRATLPCCSASFAGGAVEACDRDVVHGHGCLLGANRHQVSPVRRPLRTPTCWRCSSG